MRADSDLVALNGRGRNRNPTSPGPLAARLDLNATNKSLGHAPAETAELARAFDSRPLRMILAALAVLLVLGTLVALTTMPIGHRGADNELTVNSRSMLQIMQAFASHLDVPEARLQDRSAWPSLENAPAAESREQTLRIHSGKDKPAGTFAAVRDRDYWFWVDNGDRPTKRALTVVMFFFTLAETGSPAKLPLVTIPAQ